MEDGNLWPHEMVDLGPKLSTQNVMLRLKHDIKDKKELDTKVILVLHLTKAFENVRHEAVLRDLEKVNVGKRTYEYIKGFLRGREAVIIFQDAESLSIGLGSKGAPQGAVLSPFLFDIAIRGLSAMLNKIPDLKFSMYADGINKWMNSGSDVEIECSMQRAADIVVK
ncbi:uncharacterized protein LOC144133742 [Amblyomma americanum]